MQFSGDQMTTINDKISLIIDTDNLFRINSDDVQKMISGDTYRINILYKDAINTIKRNKDWNFKHMITNELMTLGEWIKYYQSDINDPKSLSIFFRIAEPILN